MNKQNDVIKFMTKTIITLLMVIVFLVSCFGIVTIMFSAAWLHTYKAFTDKEQIATIEVTPKGKNSDGYEQFEVKYTQFKKESGLMKLIFPTRQEEGEEFTETYQMIGDHVLIEAHTVKLADFLTLLNFKAIYKITAIEGDFVDDKDKARNLPTGQRTIYDLNGGVDGNWKWIKNNESKIRILVDTAEVSIKGKPAGEKSQRWGVFITEEGITLDTPEDN